MSKAKRWNYRYRYHRLSDDCSICAAYGSRSSSISEQFPWASRSARLISRSVRHELPPMTQLSACASYQLTPGAAYRVFLPDYWRAVEYYVDTETDVRHGGTSLSRLLFNSSMSPAFYTGGHR